MIANVLSTRLATVASYVRPDDLLIDIGTDHAYLPISLIKSGIISNAIAGEIAAGPYRNAQSKIQEYDLEGQIELLLGSGLEILKDSSSIHLLSSPVTISICGMGGHLIQDILKSGFEQQLIPKTSRLILQANNECHLLRRYLSRKNFEIIAEEIIQDQGHLYEIIVFEYFADHEQRTAYDFLDFEFGPYLRKENNEFFQKKWSEQSYHLKIVREQILQARNLNENKLREIEAQIFIIEELLND